MQEGKVGFEEGMSWLPSQVLREACDVKRSKYNPRAGVSSNRAIGGPGMQAVFIKSGHQPSGTGVFIPSKAGSNLHANKKPACSSILLPAHVVDALNLNVHAMGLGLNVSTTKVLADRKSDTCGEGGISLKTQRGENDEVYCVLTHSKNSSAEIYLPEEWSY